MNFRKALDLTAFAETESTKVFDAADCRFEFRNSGFCGFCFFAAIRIASNVVRVTVLGASAIRG
jgi:hypothetical protein